MSCHALGAGKHIPVECQYLFTKIQTITMTIHFTLTVMLTPNFKKHNFIYSTPVSTVCLITNTYIQLKPNKYG